VERICQVENLLVIFFYPFVSILFDNSQSHVNLFIRLNLVVPYIEHLGKLAKGIVRWLFTKLFHPRWSCVPQHPLEVCNLCTLLGNPIDFYHLFKHMHMCVWVWVFSIFWIIQEFPTPIKISSCYHHGWYGWIPWKIGILIGWHSSPSWKYWWEGRLALLTILSLV